MEATPRRGLLVAVLGIDGAGKTTQVSALSGWLNGQGVAACPVLNQTMLPVRTSLDVIAHEDGYRDHLDMLGADTIRLISACAKFAALATIDRYLDTPGVVALVDRYTYCQYAAVRLQQAGNEEFLRRLNRPLPQPDLTIFLDVEPAEAQRRIRQRGIDDESIEFLTNYRAAYRSLPEFAKFIIVDGNGSEASVQQSLRDAVTAVMA